MCWTDDVVKGNRRCGLPEEYANIVHLPVCMYGGQVYGVVDS